MSFVSDILKQKSSFSVKGGFQDCYLDYIVRRLLSASYDLVFLTPADWRLHIGYSRDTLIDVAKKPLYVVSDLDVFSPADLMAIGSSSSFVCFFVPWQRTGSLWDGCLLPEIVAPRITDSRNGAAIANDWLHFLGFDCKITPEVWKTIYRPGYDVLSDVVKTCLVFDSVTRETFDAVERESSQESITSQAIVSALISSDIRLAFKAVTSAWAAGVPVIPVIESIVVKIDTYNTYFLTGMPEDAALDAAGIRGQMRRDFSMLYRAFPPRQIDFFWKALSDLPREDCHTRDLFLVLSLFGK